VAQRLYDRGLRDKALRVENCAKIGRVGTCPNGHKSRHLSFCGLRFCDICHIQLADKLYRHWLPMLHLAEDTAKNHPDIMPAQFTYVEVTAQIERTTDAMVAVADDMHSAFIDRMIELGAQRPCRNSDFGDPGGWDMFAGFDAEGFHFRTLQMGAGFPLAAWQAIWPTAKIRVHVVPMYRLSYFFKEHLLAPFIPADSIERAEHEILFEGFHRLRNHLVYIGDGSPEDISVGFSLDDTEKSSDDDEAQAAQEVKKPLVAAHHCPICKIGIKIFGPWLSIDRLNAELATATAHPPPN